MRVWVCGIPLQIPREDEIMEGFSVEVDEKENVTQKET